jgi:D-3-phosphoglycerate dehydrogenase / 2-oxoglutarate reductase
MKPSSVFMNIGRGSTVNENHLVDALRNKTIAGAVLDVFTTEPLPKESDFWNLDNVLIYPHCGFNDKDSTERAWKVFTTNISNF